MPRDCTAYVIFITLLVMYSPLIFRGIQYMNRNFIRNNVLPNFRRVMSRSINPYTQRGNIAAGLAGAAALGLRQANIRNTRSLRAPMSQALVVRKPQKPVRPINSLPKIMTAAPVAISRPTRAFAPRITADNSSSRIVHREFIGKIVGSANWQVMLNFAINPGLSATFPWLSTQAQSWEYYHFNSLTFEYVSRSNTSVSGAISIIPDYDAADAQPPSEVAASNYQNMASDVVWNHLNCSLKQSSMHPNGKKYIRANVLGPNLDIKTYDAGNLFIACTDGTAVPWGNLWVSYDVTLSVPNLVSPNLINMYYNNGTAPSTTQNLGGAGIPTPGSTPNLVSLSPSIITFNAAGSFYVQYVCSATTSTTAAGVALGPGVNIGTTFYGGTVYNAGSGTTKFSQSFTISTPLGGTVTLGNTIVLGVAWILFVTQIPNGSA